MGIPASASPFVSQLFSSMSGKLLTCWSKVCASASPLQGLCESHFGQRGSSESQRQNLSRCVLSSGSSPPATGHLGNAGTRVSLSRTAHSPQNSSRPCSDQRQPRARVRPAGSWHLQPRLGPREAGHWQCSHPCGRCGMCQCAQTPVQTCAAVEADASARKVKIAKGLGTAT